MSEHDAAIGAAADQVAAAARHILAAVMPAARATVDRHGPDAAIAWMAFEYASRWHPADMAGMLAAALSRLVELERQQDRVGHYWSTACYHAALATDPDEVARLHGYCQADTGHAGTKTPARCKFGDEPCRCPCHDQAPR